MIIGLQIIALIFAFCMIYFAYVAYKKHDLEKSEIVSWITIWSGAIVIIVFPQLLRQFSMTLLLTRVFDLMVICGFVLVLTLVGSSYLKTKRLERKMEELVRKDAIKNVKTPTK